MEMVNIKQRRLQMNSKDGSRCVYMEMRESIDGTKLVISFSNKSERKKFIYKNQKLFAERFGLKVLNEKDKGVVEAKRSGKIINGDETKEQAVEVQKIFIKEFFKDWLKWVSLELAI